LLAPTVLFLENLDLLAHDRELGRAGGRALGELMNQLDGVGGDQHVFTLATTNRLEVVEKALRNRPGRFDRVIEVPPPDAASRLAFLRWRLGPHGLAEDDLAWLTQRTDGETGAALEELVNTALFVALEGAEGEKPGPGDLAADAPIRVTRATVDQAWAQCHLEQGGRWVGFLRGEIRPQAPASAELPRRMVTWATRHFEVTSER
jgi:SpoVK/Ycf46/Vps4 family AAA+-type ATPase